MSSIQNLIDFLQDYHTRVFACEAEAKKALDASDGDAYQKAMKEKAVLMSRIHEEAGPLLAALVGDVQQMAEDKLRRFSRVASFSLEINSPFFWSALLWDEDAPADQPDNLQLFINELKASQEA